MTLQGTDTAGRSYSVSHKKLSKQQSEARRKRGGSMDNLIDSIETSKISFLFSVFIKFFFVFSREDDQNISRYKEKMLFN